MSHMVPNNRNDTKCKKDLSFSKGLKLHTYDVFYFFFMLLPFDAVKHDYKYIFMLRFISDDERSILVPNDSHKYVRHNLLRLFELFEIAIYVQRKYCLSKSF